MAMMVREKRLALVAKMESREGKNTYTQSTRRSRGQWLQRLLQPGPLGL